MRLLTLGAACLLTAGLASCGSVSKAAKEPPAKAVSLAVSHGSFPSRQVPGDEVTLTLRIRNTGRNPAPDLIVRLDGLQDVTKDDPLDAVVQHTSKTDLPDSTRRAPWFVDDAPGGSALSNSFLYTGGSLPAGASRTLRWQMNAVTPGQHQIKYQVWSGLTDNEARATSGSGLTGSVSATIAKK